MGSSVATQLGPKFRCPCGARDWRACGKRGSWGEGRQSALGAAAAVAGAETGEWAAKKELMVIRDTGAALDRRHSLSR